MEKSLTAMQNDRKVKKLLALLDLEKAYKAKYCHMRNIFKNSPVEKKYYEEKIRRGGNEISKLESMLRMFAI